ncbi:MAG: hypothetical protein A2751_05495 [Candidatus Doudnabacteria bacterium RIFCSPHIGHO2_01_FULL_46_14]|uniref:Type 4 fimbrial biogenesis protein PilX N-terminal domain-containing protein n=1 Tax=Candidatus Doudnabacteria bacterium RIFCSPHIGHO2_01_FULL_46_14 TaxID=1817824 RepID=A0A1F5NNV7_9BACT|nr:MAG: hypothetical protein A2751_05495 [Candidatus Doudnabacteria bacterium RIFCSPHIGHO2_01_FULL_46_14]
MLQATSYKLESGYILLISVLVVSAVGVAVSIAVILFGLGSSRSSFSMEQSGQSKSLVNACADEALERIREDTAFTGQGNLSLGQGVCGYNVVSLGGQNRLITASSTVGTVIRKASINIDAINPKINVSSWLEVADF